MRNIHLDIETGDPDDIFTLALLATHPRVNLVSVTVHPGGTDQVGLAKHVLGLVTGKDILVGAGEPKSNKPRVSGFHYKWLGPVPARTADGSARNVILNSCSTYPDLHLVTGAALTNIAAAARESTGGFFGGGWTCQGGFVGQTPLSLEGLTPLDKFKGKETVHTYNLGGDYRAAQYLLGEDSPVRGPIQMVGKNVCHGLFWTPQFQAQVSKGVHEGLDLVCSGMEVYFRENPGGKALHDIVAACLAVDPGIGQSLEVTPYRMHDGSWGCRSGGNIKALVGLEAQDILPCLY